MRKGEITGFIGQKAREYADDALEISPTALFENMIWSDSVQKTVPVPTNPAQLFYNDVSPEEAQAHVHYLQPQGFLSFDEEVPPYDLGEIPFTYLLCSQDNALLPVVQERVVKLLGERCAVKRCDASHSPFLSKLDLVVDLIEKYR